jgi:GNAT superfamily N-acetyltransferase
MSLRRLGCDDGEAAARFALMASLGPGGEPPAGGLDAPIVRRWFEDWGDELGVGWEQDGKRQGAAWARRVMPTLLYEPASGEPLPEVIVCVVEELRGRGIGTRLIRGLLDLATDVSCPGLSLTVSKRNVAAVRLYERAGFVRDGQGLQGLLAMAWRPSTEPDE